MDLAIVETADVTLPPFRRFPLQSFRPPSITLNRRCTLRGFGGAFSGGSLYQLADRPNVIRQSECHGRRDTQGFADAAEIVVGDVERDGGVISARLLKPLVSRVKRREAMRSERFCRTT